MCRFFDKWRLYVRFETRMEKDDGSHTISRYETDGERAVKGLMFDFGVRVVLDV